MTLSVLIVEDEVIIGLLLGDLLTDMGHEVCAIATTASEAVAASLKYRPGLMIVDVNLGADSGIAAADAIRAVARIPCIFVSGDEAVLATLASRDEVMPKPYQQRDVERAIAGALGPRRGPSRQRP